MRVLLIPSVFCRRDTVARSIATRLAWAMIKRRHGNLVLLREPVLPASQQLEQDGYALVRGVLSAEDVEALGTEITAVFESSGPDRPQDQRNEFRHGMLNPAPLSQRAIAARPPLHGIEPLLGEDCPLIANTAWRNKTRHQGGPWPVARAAPLHDERDQSGDTGSCRTRDDRARAHFDRPPRAVLLRRVTQLRCESVPC